MRGLIQVVVVCFCWTVVTACGVCDDWEVIFSAKAGSNETVYPAWIGTASVNPLAPCAPIYKPAAAEDWTLVDLVKVTVSKNNEEKAYFIFNGKGADKTSFMTYSRLITSSSGVFPASPMEFFSVAGDPLYDRRFYIQRNYGGCNSDAGWLVVVDTSNKDPCAWSNRAATPYFMYCEQTAACLADTAFIGDTFTISVKRLLRTL